MFLAVRTAKEPAPVNTTVTGGSVLVPTRCGDVVEGEDHRRTGKMVEVVMGYSSAGAELNLVIALSILSDT